MIHQIAHTEGLLRSGTEKLSEENVAEMIRDGALFKMKEVMRIVEDAVSNAEKAVLEMSKMIEAASRG